MEKFPIKAIKKMKRILALIFLFALFLAGCMPVAGRTTAPTAAFGTKTLHVFAAASLTDAFTEIGRNFETLNPGTTIAFNFAGSQALRTQIEEGAPADIFASANQTEMETLIADSLIVQDAPQQFLSNQLVIILPENNPAGLEKVEDLAKPGIKIVLSAEEVPVGRYARQALDSMNTQFGASFRDKVLANVVSNEENVRQVVAKVQLGEADVGIVYTSDAIAATALRTIEIPADLNVIAKYPIAPLARSENAGLAQDFIAYVLSADGQAVLQKWGFAPPR